ncbi:cytochrome b/b6 domain-containing protein [Bosea sp. ANAM02]|uniref:cytochrome b n=1 Tax=Bosea sp. ANAM02 TaxID=2020412 RepID=UPI0015675B70|nr:cytochrome b/b6 domain-containing protein [Bosea sp. ANAM02]
MSLLHSVLLPKVSSGKSFGAYQRWIHWSVPVLCIAQVPTSWAIQRTHLAHGFTRPNPFDLLLHQVHAWTGWLITGLALVLIALRYIHGRPSLEGLSPLERWTATGVHVALYGLLLLLPFTGTVAMYLSFRAAPLHRLLSWTLLVLALVHVAGALWHHFHRRDDILRRMLKSHSHNHERAI